MILEAHSVKPFTHSKLTAVLFNLGNTAIYMPHTFTDDLHTVIMCENTYILFVHLVIKISFF